MKLIAIGDNVTDCYIDEGVYFPGGNAVNVAVNCRKNGAEKVNYIGVFGDDERADYIKECLTEEGVTYDRSRKVYAHTAQPKVYLKDGDRVFAPGLRDSCQHLFAIKIVKEDIEVIEEYDICHTSCYSNLEYELPELQKVCKVSFDFSDRREDSYLERTCPYLSFAFFSGSELSEEECEAFAKKVHGLGTKIVGITRGSKGAVFYDGTRIYRQGIKKVEAIDTMGAGDSFIAGFLTAYGDGRTMEEALDYAAERSALTCTVRGGFGHPHAAE
ncbi:carbohydrate kinase [Clostridium sp. MCC353]|uniref:PfkB family carbohydrate kinase n=1 Tax=Clostridium sp. MCC353 TaxID=2592646 RepID=UPI001C0319FD|nr:PfkB family carbohydrate kinase [Clostridium sp. MCC353]MBT9775859.1 carbohydrate kinase [Clostridium sp. MCC353]